MESVHAPGVTRDDPYPGLSPYEDTPAAHALFFGRDREKSELLQLVLAERLVLLFSRSGLGKSSLVNAALLPELRKRGFVPVVARLAQDPARSPVEAVLSHLHDEVGGPPPRLLARDAEPTLWEGFFAAQAAAGGEGQFHPVLIIDQFEELFTLVRDRNPEWEQTFVEQLADLVRRRVPEALRTEISSDLEKLRPDSDERKKLISVVYGDAGPDVRVLLVIREDFVSELERLKTSLPGIFRASLRLLPLAKEQARLAIEAPGGTGELNERRFYFEPEATELMLSFLSKQRRGGIEVDGDTVEPVQLQILCKHLNDRRRHKRAQKVTVGDLGGIRGMKRSIETYYRSVLAKLPAVRLGWNARRGRPSLANLLFCSFPRIAARRLCELGLITRGGHRNSLAVDTVVQTYGIGAGDLDRLATERLVRLEPRLGTSFCELSHDSLVAPLREMREASRQLKRRAAVAVGGIGWLAAAVMLLGPKRAAELAPAFAQPEVAAFVNENDDALRMVFDTLAPNEKRASSLRNLVSNGVAKFSSLRATDLQLDSLVTVNAQFDSASLRGLQIRLGDLRRTNFRGAMLADAVLNGADLRGSDFQGATLTGASLDRANLTGANLRNARLQGATLTSAQLDGAEFAGALIDSTTRFNETAWWLAHGWTQKQVDGLEQAFPHVAYSRTGSYSFGLDTLTFSYQRAETSAQRAAALTRRAWYRTVRGAELGRALRDLDALARIDPHSYQLLDTRGYIYIQQDRYPEAVRDLRRAVTLADSAAPRSARYHYRLAVALSHTGDEQESQHHLAVARRFGYRPSHELLLAPLRKAPVAARDSLPGAIPAAPSPP